MEAERGWGCRDFSTAQTPAPASLVDVDDRPTYHSYGLEVCASCGQTTYMPIAPDLARMFLCTMCWGT